MIWHAVATSGPEHSLDSDRRCRLTRATNGHRHCKVVALIMKCEIGQGCVAHCGAVISHAIKVSFRHAVVVEEAAHRLLACASVVCRFGRKGHTGSLERIR